LKRKRHIDIQYNCAAAPALLSKKLSNRSVRRREAVSIHILKRSEPRAIEQHDTANNKQPPLAHT
jgi:1,2-phenylacetyl-CoA epoxidase PaaB subunit